MNYSSTSRFNLILAISIAWSASLFLTAIDSRGDSLLMKDGTIVEGTIVSQSADFVQIQVKVTASISETKSFDRAAIAEIRKVQPDEMEFREIQKLVPTPDMLTVSDYDVRINVRPKRFLQTYPASTYKGEVEKVLKILESEKQKAVAGGVKLDGKWITSEDIAKDSYNHAARLALAKMKTAAAEGNYLEAMEAFSKIETNYPQSQAYPTAIASAGTVLNKYVAQLTAMARRNVQQLEARQRDLRQLPVEERQLTERAFEERLKVFQKRLEDAKEAGAKWLPTDEWDAKSIEEAVKVVTEETARLEAIDSESLTQSSKLLAQAAVSLGEGNTAAASVLIDKAKEIVGEDSKLVANLEEKVAAATKATQKAREAEAAARKATNAAEARAEALKAESEAKAKAKTEMAKAEEERKMAAEAAARKKGEMAGKGGDDEDGTMKDSKAGLPFPVYIGIIAVLMAVITIVARKMAGPKESEEEEMDDEDI